MLGINKAMDRTGGKVLRQGSLHSPPLQKSGSSRDTCVGRSNSMRIRRANTIAFSLDEIVIFNGGKGVTA